MCLLHLLFQWSKKSLRGEQRVLEKLMRGDGKVPWPGTGERKAWYLCGPAPPKRPVLTAGVPGNMGSYIRGVSASPEILVPHVVQRRRHRLLGTTVGLDSDANSSQDELEMRLSPVPIPRANTPWVSRPPSWVPACLWGREPSSD